MVCEVVMLFCYVACVGKKTVVAFTLSLFLCFAFCFLVSLLSVCLWLVFVWFDILVAKTAIV